MARPRRGVRGGGQAPVHLDEVEIEQGNEETLPPLPLIRICISVHMMELPFYGFDVILGIDWLVEHIARVDFETKKVSFKLADDHEIVVVGENVKSLSNVISVLEAQGLMDNGCQAYLAYVMNPNMGEARPRDIRIVCDFLRVFPEELPSLPPR
ncbi:hypothetical protein GQ457_16G018610 [Hibiscus cannabinus]